MQILRLQYHYCISFNMATSTITQFTHFTFSWQFISYDIQFGKYLWANEQTTNSKHSKHVYSLNLWDGVIRTEQADLTIWHVMKCLWQTLIIIKCSATEQFSITRGISARNINNDKIIKLAWQNLMTFDGKPKTTTNFRTNSEQSLTDVME